jgi:hypothetical protein
MVLTPMKQRRRGATRSTDKGGAKLLRENFDEGDWARVGFDGDGLARDEVDDLDEHVAFR